MDRSNRAEEFFEYIPRSLRSLAVGANFPLYVVGGSVRDFLSGYARKESDFSDWDISAPVLPNVLAEEAEKHGFTLKSVYKNTGTVKLCDQNGTGFEFTSFRSDEYVRGEHTPAKVYFTENIESDAKRRDFTCNAVYYEIKSKKFVDPLNGITDIENKGMRTVRESARVFGEDGLRLLRLARQSGQLG
ncbi:MAG: CCA tRNA nucleotidyltransferase, partial [Clostridia bacterium]|nr:CCA tRNA nucleotidyltransferase [Clostridia bacterium]